ncbi:MAG: DUF349 domain-containing protein [Flavobacterium sp.]|nr:DUF349 domain-containing protein [Flavobacterium sp.]
MLEEQNDNLPQADGNQNESQAEAIENAETPIELIPAFEEQVKEVESENTEEAKEVHVEPIESTTEEIQSTQDVTSQHDAVIEEIATANAEVSEDESLRTAIPMLDYQTMTLEELVNNLESLVTTDAVMAVKDHVEELKKSFLDQFYHLLDEKKEAFLAENPDSTESFQFQHPLKPKFDQLYTQYKARKNAYFTNLQTNLEQNLAVRLALVEELKNLINPQNNIKDTLKQFNDLRERWKNAGPIPKDKYNHVWNNYHFHIENFYDYLHLDREARDIDFKHNLELKLKIIARVEELIHETDISKAFRELQDLHRIWKEDIGPVSKDHREEIWTRFSELTKQMHDKREQLFEELRAVESANLAAKQSIIAELEALAQEKVHSHTAWLGQIEKVETLRNAFFTAGKVPADMNEATWSQFKQAVRAFNVLKNSFYKEIKKDQTDNLTKKQALVAQAKALAESTDFQTTTPLMKKIQEDWKTIGHVPRKYSDSLWTEFRAACNAYFETVKSQKKEENPDEVEAFEKKKNYLETMRSFELTGAHKADLEAIKAHIETWKSFGKVPFPRRHIEGKFNKILDALFEKLSLSKKEGDMTRFANRMEQLSESNDTRKLEGEKIFLTRKIEEVQAEIFQLENNIQFFTNTKNAKKENSIVLEVRKNIEKHKEEMAVLRDKLKKLREIV